MALLPSGMEAKWSDIELPDEPFYDLHYRLRRAPHRNDRVEVLTRRPGDGELLLLRRITSLAGAKKNGPVRCWTELCKKLRAGIGCGLVLRWQRIAATMRRLWQCGGKS